MYKILKISDTSSYRGLEREGIYPDMFPKNTEYEEIAIKYISNNESLNELDSILFLHNQINLKYQRYEVVECLPVNMNSDRHSAHKNDLGIDLISEDKWHSLIKHVLCAEKININNLNKRDMFLHIVREYFLSRINNSILFNNTQEVSHFINAFTSVLGYIPDAYDVGDPKYSSMYMVRLIVSR